MPDAASVLLQRLQAAFETIAPGADPVLRSYVGTSELQLGNLVPARQQFLQSVRLDPWTSESLEALGTIAKDEHEWTESLYWYRRALDVSLDPQHLRIQIRVDESHLKPT